MRERIALSFIGLCAASLAGCVEPGATQRYGYGYGPYAAPPPLPPAAPRAGAPAAQNPAPKAAVAAGALALPPLDLPLREDWSSQKCPDLAVTFGGHAEAMEVSLSNSVSFDEARALSDGDYREVAECFCAKTGDLTQTTEPAADAAMAETAKHLTESARMRILRSSFVEGGGSALGNFSELVASSPAPAPVIMTLRTYWRGQCSMRLSTIAPEADAARAAQFLTSIRTLKLASAEADAAPALAPAPAAQPAIPVVTDGSGDDFGSKVKARAAELERDRAAATPGAPTPAATPAAASAADPLSVRPLPPEAQARLKKLQELRAGGLITPAEYELMRHAIVSGSL